MTTEARQLAERIVREYERCQIEGCDPTCLQTRLYKAWQAGRLSGLQQAAEIATHFANDELTPEEWPKYGLCARSGRFDYGVIGETCDKVAAVIREKIAEEEK